MVFSPGNGSDCFDEMTIGKFRNRIDHIHLHLPDAALNQEPWTVCWDEPQHKILVFDLRVLLRAFGHFLNPLALCRDALDH